MAWQFGSRTLTSEYLEDQLLGICFIAKEQAFYVVDASNEVPAFSAL